MKLAIATLLAGSAAAFAPAQSSKVSVEENFHRSKDGNKPLEYGKRPYVIVEG